MLSVGIVEKVVQSVEYSQVPYEPALAAVRATPMVSPSSSFTSPERVLMLAGDSRMSRMVLPALVV